jgi:L-aspartate oxidase
MFRLDERVQTMDFLVIGAGVAGLRAAIRLAEEGDVLVITKESLGESNTHYAQGGIAVATEGEQDVALHLVDTIAAGDGLVYEPAAAVLVEEGPRRVEELIAWGADFDRQGGSAGGELLRTREAAHSHPRILHANGDATGAEISRSLVAYSRSHPRIEFAEWTMASSLILSDPAEQSAMSAPQSAISAAQSAMFAEQSAIPAGRYVIGVDLMSAKLPGTGSETGTDCGQMCRVFARSVLIASGGAGQVYSDTTNPAVATGDGIALAAEVGAELADMEFYQFHPTALSLPGVPRFLLSEALRGEGAYLRNDHGERFMERYHPSLELAPRDVVARAIAREGMGAAGESRPVYLDMRHVTGIDLVARFPGISRFLALHGLSLQKDLIPVRPAAHYMMGGIRTDLDGRTSVRGLYAAGEAACTGVHGANRLASNSLLEGLVFGARAAEAMIADELPLVTAEVEDNPRRLPRMDAQQIARAESDIAAIVTELRAMMWEHAGLLRDEKGILAGFKRFWPLLDRFEGWKHIMQPSRVLIEADALLTVAMCILESAFERKESRGAHFREDHPKRNDAEFRKHSVLELDGLLVEFQTWR